MIIRTVVYYDASMTSDQFNLMKGAFTENKMKNEHLIFISSSAYSTTVDTYLLPEFEHEYAKKI